MKKAIMLLLFIILAFAVIGCVDTSGSDDSKGTILRFDIASSSMEPIS